MNEARFPKVITTVQCAAYVYSQLNLEKSSQILGCTITTIMVSLTKWWLLEVICVICNATQFTHAHCARTFPHG